MEVDLKNFVLRKNVTKRDILKMVADAKRDSEAYFKTEVVELDRLIKMFEQSSKLLIAQLPDEVRAMPYFEYLKKTADMSDKALLSSAVENAIKHNREEFQNSIILQSTKKGKVANAGVKTVKRVQRKDSLRSLPTLHERDGNDSCSSAPSLKSERSAAPPATRGRPGRLAKPAFASTPMQQEPVFRLPTSARPTRSVRATREREAHKTTSANATRGFKRSPQASKTKATGSKRLWRPNDSLYSTEGSPILNPFELTISSLQSLSVKQLESLRSFALTVIDTTCS